MNEFLLRERKSTSVSTLLLRSERMWRLFELLTIPGAIIIVHKLIVDPTNLAYERIFSWVGFDNLNARAAVHHEMRGLSQPGLRVDNMLSIELAPQLNTEETYGFQIKEWVEGPNGIPFMVTHTDLQWDHIEKKVETFKVVNVPQEN